MAYSLPADRLIYYKALLSNAELDWTQVSVSASTTGQATCANYSAVAVIAEEDGYFKSSGTEISGSDVTSNGQFTPAGISRIYTLMSGSSGSQYIGFRAKDAIATKFSYVILGRDE